MSRNAVSGQLNYPEVPEDLPAEVVLKEAAVLGREELQTSESGRTGD